MALPERERHAAYNHARDYIDRGFRVTHCYTPLQRDDGTVYCSCGNREKCTSTGKHPVGGVTKAIGAPLDEKKLVALEDWFDVSAEHLANGALPFNIGVKTGLESGIVVLDIDPKNKGDETLAALVAKHGPMPVTPTVQTGSTGTHFYLLRPTEGLATVDGLFPGIDLKADGGNGHVVAPPSLHKSGNRYEWKPGLNPSVVPFAPVPAWILDAVLERKAKKRSRPAGGAAPGTVAQGARWAGGVIPGGEQHNTLFRWGCSMRAHGAGQEEIDAELVRMSREDCEPPGDEAKAHLMALDIVTRYPAGDAKYSAHAAQRGSGGRPASTAAGLPQVEHGIDVHRVLEDLDKALSRDPRVFQRAGELVIARGVLAEDAARLKLNFAPGTIVLAPLHAASLLPRVTEHVDYGAWGADGKWTRKLPPPRVLGAFLSKVYWAHIPRIRGIARNPVIHLDGTITDNGYDASTQYYVASSIALPAIPVSPTHDDARAALASLREPFAQFPFESDAERDSPVALTLTLILRPVIRGNVPAFVWTAPQKNCGKSLVAKGACLLATGQIPASNTWAKLDEEQEKMIGAAAEAGASVLFFDNVPEGSTIGGAPLDKVLTCDGRNSFRLLGFTQLKELPWEATVCFTANRAHIGGDTDRRAVVSTLIRPDVPPVAYMHPDLLGYIESERPRLLAAAFTLVRAWVHAGSPDAGIRRLDSFEHWGRTVAAMIRWSGGGDVRELVHDVEGTVEDNQEHALLEGVYNLLQQQGLADITVKALVREAYSPQRTDDHGVEVVPEQIQSLRDAIEDTAGHEGKGSERRLNTKRLGKRLAGMKDVRHGEYRLKAAGKDHQAVRWTVVKVGRGVGGVRGVDLDCTRVKDAESGDRSSAGKTESGDEFAYGAGINSPHSPNSPAPSSPSPATICVHDAPPPLDLDRDRPVWDRPGIGLEAWLAMPPSLRAALGHDRPPWEKQGVSREAWEARQSSFPPEAVAAPQDQRSQAAPPVLDKKTRAKERKSRLRQIAAEAYEELLKEQVEALTARCQTEPRDAVLRDEPTDRPVDRDAKKYLRDRLMQQDESAGRR